MKIRRIFRNFLLVELVLSVVVVGVPYGAGLYYAACGDRYVEQTWLNEVQGHLKVLRANCDDPDLQRVLDYAAHFDKIGAWNVMVMPLANFTLPLGSYKTVGCNCPFCPGVTIDPEVMTYPIHDGAMVLVHETLHNWFPYFGHSQVTPRIKKLEVLWQTIQFDQLKREWNKRRKHG